jgi:hypothetical protein
MANKNKKKIVLISLYGYYNSRLVFLSQELVKKNYEVIYITSLFDHISKQNNQVMDFKFANKTILVKTIKYKKNISLARLISNIFSSSNIFFKTLFLRPTVVYIMIPPDALIFFFGLFKSLLRYKLIVDVYDLWPESLPRNSIIFNVIKFFWKKNRNFFFSSIDFLIVECWYYLQFLPYRKHILSTQTIYPTFGTFKMAQVTSFNQLNFLYLGSINNIIDIDLIIDLLIKLNKIKSTHIYIVGSGENKDKFLTKLINNNLGYSYFGNLYKNELYKFINNKNIHFGLNIMKSNIKVGFTMKSASYFMYGLPIINNIKGDTYDFINQYKIGFNLDNLDNFIKILAFNDLDKIKLLKGNVKSFFNQNISPKVTTKSYLKVIKKVII